jgi:predicted RNA polymerase sigma factor
MAQRISRAKQRVMASEVLFRTTARRRVRRAAAVVLHVLYLIFTESHATTPATHVAAENWRRKRSG